MKKEKEIQYLNGLLKTMDSQADADIRAKLIQWLCFIAGFAGYISAYFMAKNLTLEPKHCVTFSFVSGVLFCVGIYVRVVRQYSPVTVSHLSRESIVARLNEIKT
ncbi:hypothetical protein [Microbulbifer sp. TRSA005]|uniref:hypothetical protein n=1 Tax=Microbulbifer sp. TRSA005 TaxID=3243383 RepID=UPI0040394273